MDRNNSRIGRAGPYESQLSSLKMLLLCITPDELIAMFLESCTTCGESCFKFLILHVCKFDSPGPTQLPVRPFIESGKPFLETVPTLVLHVEISRNLEDS